MLNREIAKILYEIADFLEMEEVQFKPQAYRKAANSLENLEEDVEEIYREGGEKAIEEIPGIGKSIASKIIEYIKEGEIEYYKKLKEKSPIEMDEIKAVEGLGPKMAQALYEHLGVKNIEDLEKAAEARKIRDIKGFGEKTEQNILEGIEFLSQSKGRFLLGNIMPVVKEIKERLKSLEEVGKISVTGSVRRRKETIGDADFLVTSDKPEKVMDFFTSMSDVVKVWGKGETKSSVRLKQGFDVDLRVIDNDSFGAALQYFTGSKEHNIKTRRIAIGKGFKLNEYGLFKGKEKIAGKTEKEVYKKLDLKWIPPEIREDKGEIEASSRKDLPNLVKLKDIKGDLHSHTKRNGGMHSIKEMAEKAMELGYDYLGISDHTKKLRIEQGLNEKQLTEQRKEVERINREFEDKGLNFKILQGAETNILKDGSIDINDEALEKLDYAIAGVHSHFNMSKEAMTRRIIRAMENPHINIISHPTGRILKRRDEYEINLEKIFKVAKENDIVLEVNSFPERLDLNDVNIKKTIEMGIKLVINTDSHQRNHMDNMKYGIFQARRGWAEKKDIINAMPLNKLLKVFEK